MLLRQTDGQTDGVEEWRHDVAETDRWTGGVEERHHDVAETDRQTDRQTAWRNGTTMLLRQTDRQTDGVEERHHDVAEDVDRQRPLVPLGLHPDDRAFQLAPSHQQKN